MALLGWLLSTKKEYVSAHLFRQEIECIVAGIEIYLLGVYLLDTGLEYSHSNRPALQPG